MLMLLVRLMFLVPPMDESSIEATHNSPSYSSFFSQVSPVDSAGQAPASGQSEPLVVDERFNQLDEYDSGSQPSQQIPNCNGNNVGLNSEGDSVISDQPADDMSVDSAATETDDPTLFPVSC